MEAFNRPWVSGRYGICCTCGFEPYRLERLTSFVNPFASPDDSGFQLINGYLAISNGGVTGLGLGQSLQKMRMLPEGHTDFILAVISEELGLLGLVFIFGCYAIILFRGISIGAKCKIRLAVCSPLGLCFSLRFKSF